MLVQKARSSPFEKRAHRAIRFRLSSSARAAVAAAVAAG